VGTAEALGFVRGLQTRRRDKDALKQFVDDVPLGTLQRIGRRIMMDLMKAPPQGAPVPNAEKVEPANQEPAPATPRHGKERSGATGRRRPAREP